MNTILIPMSTGGGPSGPLPWWAALMCGGFFLWVGIFVTIMVLSMSDSMYDWTDRAVSYLLWMMAAALIITGVVFLFIPIWGVIT